MAIVMADGSDDPRDLLRYFELLEEGYDCAFGSRFMRGRPASRDYPRVKLAINRLVNLGIRVALPARLQRHDERVQGLPARGDRERPAAALAALQPDGRAAAEGDRARPLLRDRADLLDEPRGGRVEARRSRRWARRYLFIVLLVFLEHHLSRGDYRRPGYRDYRPRHGGPRCGRVAAPRAR